MGESLRLPRDGGGTLTLVRPTFVILAHDHIDVASHEPSRYLPHDPPHSDLSSWARQGVLLLNTSLTVRAHEANSHSKRGWETFTEKVLKLIVDRLSEKGAEVGGKGVVFLAWGAGAGKLVKGISEVSLRVSFSDRQGG